MTAVISQAVTAPDVTARGASANGVRLIATYATTHGIAEFVTALTLFSLLSMGRISGGQIVVYSVIAFGCPIALAALASLQKSLSEGYVGLAGAILLATGLVLPQLGWAAVLLLGFGSATFHIAAGTATLKLPRRGMAVGVFESSGAIGLAAGTVLGGGAWSLASTSVWAGVAAVVVVAGGLAVLRWGSAGVRRTTGEADPAGYGLSAQLTDAMVGCPRPRRSDWTIVNARNSLPAMGLLVLAAVSLMRSIVGFAAPEPWKGGAAMVMWAAVVVMLGRALGGIIADRWGGFAPAMVGFVGAAVFMGLWPGAIWAGLLGAFCLALPMAPVILAMVSCTRRPSISFGLAQLFQVPAALTLGIVMSGWAVFAVLLVGAVLVLAMRPYDERTIK